MPAWMQLLLALAFTVLAVNVLWWGVWRHYLVGGKYDTTGPRFTHDSDCDTFLGRWSMPAEVAEGHYMPGHEVVEFDLWYCPAEPCLIARFSDEGNDYYSGGPEYGRPHHPALAECFDRVMAQGLYTSPEGWWVGLAGPFDHTEAVEFSLRLNDGWGTQEIPYLVDAYGEVVPGMAPCTICRSMCMDPGGIHLTPAWKLAERAEAR